MSEKTLVLVDGENLVLRYESSCKEGHRTRGGVKHKKGTYVWHNGIATMWTTSILRVSYYTTFVGDDQALNDLSNEISNITYPYSRPETLNAHASLNPRIFKKEKKQSKTKSVDINLTIDALRHAYSHNVHRIVICSGDGDYLPLIEEVMRNGIIVNIAAFKNGCHPAMKYSSDAFIELDRMFFGK